MGTRKRRHMINKNQLRELIIRPTLLEIGLHSLAAENLLMGTAAQESRLGSHIRQVGGPALGIYQMEPATHNDLWVNYLRFNPALEGKFRNLLAGLDRTPRPEQMIYDMRYATAMCRLHYRRVKAPLPDDVSGMSEYWKQYYNTPMGRGSTQDFVNNYRRYAG